MRVIVHDENFHQNLDEYDIMQQVECKKITRLTTFTCSEAQKLGMDNGKRVMEQIFS